MIVTSGSQSRLAGGTAPSSVGAQYLLGGLDEVWVGFAVPAFYLIRTNTVSKYLGELHFLPIQPFLFLSF